MKKLLFLIIVSCTICLSSCSMFCTHRHLEVDAIDKNFVWTEVHCLDCNYSARIWLQDYEDMWKDENGKIHHKIYKAGDESEAKNTFLK